MFDWCSGVKTSRAKSQPAGCTAVKIHVVGFIEFVGVSAEPASWVEREGARHHAIAIAR